MPQKIIDLDAAVPEPFGVKLNDQIYELPGDIPIPDLIAIERAVADLEDPKSETPGIERMEALYDQVIALFRIRQPELDELPLGAEQLGSLIGQIYNRAADNDDAEGKAPAPTSGTPSTSKTKSRRSRGSK